MQCGRVKMATPEEPLRFRNIEPQYVTITPWVDEDGVKIRAVTMFKDLDTGQFFAVPGGEVDLKHEGTSLQP